MDLIVNEMLLDCLNLAKVVFKNGLTGTIILGDKEKEENLISYRKHGFKDTTSLTIEEFLNYIDDLKDNHKI